MSRIPYSSIYTKFSFTVCYENTIPALVTSRTIKSVELWSDCKNECDQDVDCLAYRYKVMMNSLVLSLYLNFLFRTTRN